MKKEFNVGDRVIGKGCWCGFGLHGKTGTIIEKGEWACLVEFDENVGGHNGTNAKVKGKDGHCWWVLCEDLELIKNPDKLIFKGKETILIKDGKEYVSKCADGDTYDKEKGLLLCLAKANGVNYEDLQKMIDGAEDKNLEMAYKFARKFGEALLAFAEAGRKAVESVEKEVKALKKKAKNTVKEVERPAKVGEYIKIVNAKLTGGYYKNGDVRKVTGQNVNTVFIDDNVCVHNSEYVVLENYKPYKITLSEFWKSKDKLAIHCKTEYEAKELLKAFDKAGKKWGSKDRYTEFTNWGENKENTLYYNCNTYGNIYRAENTTIYEFNEVDLNN